jgi:Protein of unknown function DUF262
MAETQHMQQQLETQRRKVDVDNFTITVRELLSMVERHELRRAPAYQRKFRWDEEAESRLIESILLGLPIPNLFFATNVDGTWEVVDGLQRISTLIHFAPPSDGSLKEVGKGKPLGLEGLRKLSDFNGRTFESLPTPLQLLFTKRGLGVTALSDKSDPETRFDTFERLNRGAVALTLQEVRACIYEGALNDLLRELADSPGFRNLVKLQKSNEENATREELVLKFFAYYHDRERFDGAVGQFLTDYMEREQHRFDVEAERKRFNSVVNALGALLQGGPVLRRTTNVTPQNELEAVMVGAAHVLQEHGRLGKPSPDWLDDPELVAASTAGANTPRKLRLRIERAVYLLTPREDGHSD